MIQFILYTLICLFLQHSMASATEPSPAAQLRKLSLSLQGHVPTADEFKEINILHHEQVPGYLQDKANAYMSTNSFVEKMHQRLQTLFRMKLPEKIKYQYIPDDEEFNSLNTLDSIFLDIIENNLSWDQLLQRNTYQVFTSDELGFSNQISDAGFFKAVFPEQILDSTDGVITDPNAKLKSGTKQIINVKTENQKLTTASTLTTSRFFARYTTTKINKNRRRAAAIFRIFLCDDMQPAISPNANDYLELLSLAFNEGPHQTAVSATEADEKKHGSDPQCQNCHYKLDPAGKTFMTSSLILNPTPSPGALVYKREDGSLVNIPVKGIGELAQTILQQPEYVQCQVQHFWNWFIGKDVVLTESQKNHLIDKFNSVERKPKDFILYLVSLPAFRHAPNDQFITLANVKPILKQCNNCHDMEGTMPTFTVFPIDGNKRNHSSWIKKIADELDLANSGANASMPPKKKTEWRLSTSEVELLKRWVAEGARDESSQRTISEEISEELIPEGIKIDTKRTATFDDTFLRYLPTFDLFRVLDQFLGTNQGLEERCFKLNRDNDYLLGAKSVVNGKVLLETVSPNFLRLVQECAIYFYDAHAVSEDTNIGSLIRYSPFLINRKDNANVSSLIWKDLTNIEQNNQIEYLVSQLIGTKVLPNDKLNYNVNSIRKAISGRNAKLILQGNSLGIDLATATRWATTMIIASEDFLTF